MYSSSTVEEELSFINKQCHKNFDGFDPRDREEK